jgi:hypothetical protein
VRTENAWRALEQVSALIRFADAKAVAALSVSGLLAGWVLTTFPSRRLLGAEAGTAVLSGGLLVALTVAALFALLAIRPRTRFAHGGSLIQFEETAKRFLADPDRFAKSCKNLFTEDDWLIDEICRQLGVNAALAVGKFRNVNRAFVAFALGLGLAIAAAVARLLLRTNRSG